MHGEVGDPEDTNLLNCSQDLFSRDPFSRADLDARGQDKDGQDSP